MEREYWNLEEEEYILHRERNYSTADLNSKTAETRRYLLDLIKKDKEREEEASKKARNTQSI